MMSMERIPARKYYVSTVLYLRKLAMLDQSVLIFVICVCFSASIVVLGAKENGCNMTERLDHKDKDILVKEDETSCKLMLESPDKRQIVVVLHNLYPDCTTRGNITIYDGTEYSHSLINSMCRGRPLSFASRKYGLIVQLEKPYMPFRMDAYLIDTTRNFSGPSGIIKSQRYEGYISGEDPTETTPNNLHATYNIRTEYNVTMQLTFTEFRVHPGLGGKCSLDMVKVQYLGHEGTFCGDKITIKPVSVVTDRVSIQFFTDKFTTYSGFTVKYNVCEIRTAAQNRTGTVSFPFFKSENGASHCAFVLEFDEKKMITFYDIRFNTHSRNCLDTSKVISETEDVSNTTLKDCVSEFNITTRHLLLLFASVSAEEFFYANYTIEDIMKVHSPAVLETTKLTDELKAATDVNASKTMTDTSDDDEFHYVSSGGQNMAIVTTPILIITVVGVAIFGMVLRFKCGKCRETLVRCRTKSELDKTVIIVRRQRQT